MVVLAAIFFHANVSAEGSGLLDIYFHFNRNVSFRLKVSTSIPSPKVYILDPKLYTLNTWFGP